MKKTYQLLRHFGILAFIIVGCIRPVGACGWDNIQMQLSSSRDVYLRGEPVVISARFINVGTCDVKFPTTDLDVTFDTVEVYISSDQGESKQYQSWYVEEPGETAFVIAPNEEKSISFRLHWNVTAGRYAFLEGEQQEVFVRIPDFMNGHHLSGKVTVFIGDNFMLLDTKEHTLLMDPKVAAVLQGVAEPDANMIERFKNGVERGSVFGYVLAESLGQYYLNKGVENPQLLDLSLDYFKKSVQLVPEDDFTIKAANMGLLKAFQLMPESLPEDQFIHQIRALDSKDINMLEMKHALPEVDP